MPQEIELKLALPSALARALGSLDCIAKRAQGPATKRQYRAVYFDAADHRLAQAKAALRIRREAGTWVQTLKLAPAEGLGFSERIELNWPLPRFGLDLAALDGSPLAQREDWTELRGQLKRRFTTQFEREAWALQWPDGSRIELALDHGTITSGRRRGGGPAPASGIQEIELEVLQGRAEHVWALAFELTRSGPLVPLSASKAQRGYELLQPAAEPKRSKPQADPEQVEFATQLALGIKSTLQALHHNLRHAHRAEAEYIHQARVALRRLRSLLRAAQRLAWRAPQRKALQALRDPLQALGQRLGAVRDADVLAFDTLPRLCQYLGEQWLDAVQALNEPAARLRQEAYDQLAEIWMDPVLGRGLLQAEHLVWMIERDPAGFRPRGDASARAIALAQLGAQHEALWKASRDLSRQTVEQLHGLRIQAKRMRYLLEFWTPLWAKSELKAYRTGLVALIESLGAISDDASAILALAKMQADAGLMHAIEAQAQAQRQRRLPAIAGALVELDLARMPWRA